MKFKIGDICTFGESQSKVRITDLHSECGIRFNAPIDARALNTGVLLYFKEKELTHFPANPTWTLVIHPDKSDPDITIAVLTVDGVKRTESVKRNHEDVYSRDEAIKAIVVKMMMSPVKEVKRRAKVGEWIKIVNAVNAGEHYKNGDVLQVQSVQEFALVAWRIGCAIMHSEYVVLENYTPPVEPAKPDPVKIESFVKKCSTCNAQMNPGYKWPCVTCTNRSNWQAKSEVRKPEPIMIGGKELRVGSKFILKHGYSVSDSFNLGTCGWTMLRDRVHQVDRIGSDTKLIHFSTDLPIGKQEWRIRAADIDRILED